MPAPPHLVQERRSTTEDGLREGVTRAEEGGGETGQHAPNKWVADPNNTIPYLLACLPPACIHTTYRHAVNDPPTYRSPPTKQLLLLLSQATKKAFAWARRSGAAAVMATGAGAVLSRTTTCRRCLRALST
jgi:hypothetical protein